MKRKRTLTDNLDDVEGLAETVESDGGVNTLSSLLPDRLYILESTTPGLGWVGLLYGSGQTCLEDVQGSFEPGW